MNRQFTTGQLLLLVRVVMPVVVEPVVASIKCPEPPVTSSIPIEALSEELCEPDTTLPYWNSITLVVSYNLTWKFRRDVALVLYDGTFFHSTVKTLLGAVPSVLYDQELLAS